MAIWSKVFLCQVSPEMQAPFTILLALLHCHHLGLSQSHDLVIQFVNDRVGDDYGVLGCWLHHIHPHLNLTSL